ncbi:hypothetical protein [Nonomuraea roseola]|uniref:Pentapeptide repeat-containing protein n=1 Tax=Nonomuraea roseola TaxID=46179 RepID=A0ABV5QC27_9ACTN
MRRSDLRRSDLRRSDLSGSARRGPDLGRSHLGHLDLSIHLRSTTIGSSWRAPPSCEPPTWATSSWDVSSGCTAPRRPSR